MKKLTNEDKAGLYITVIVHLTVIIILLLLQISANFKKENSFLIDFTREEALEQKLAEEHKQMEDEAFDEMISRRVQEMMAGNTSTNFRNVAVDRAALKDDRGTDARQLYEDAARLAKDLRDGIAPDEPDDDYVEIDRKVRNEAPKEQKEFSGPSVVSYTLDGRKASKLPIPAYRCYGGGMVVVIITVDNSGKVIDARVQEEGSTNDRCLREFAVRAARLSRFSSDPKAPARQKGDIIYQFIAQ